MFSIDELLTIAAQNGVSDVHITVNSAPAFRLHGSLVPLDSPEWMAKLGLTPDIISKLTPADTDTLSRQIVNNEQYKQFMDTGDIDFFPELTIFKLRKA